MIKDTAEQKEIIKRQGQIEQDEKKEDLNEESKKEEQRIKGGDIKSERKTWRKTALRF